MKKSKISLVLLVAAATFLLVYSPHYTYRFPSHADEWHHITETLRILNGGYTGNTMGLRFGFHMVLLPLAFCKNFVLIYKYLPAAWAVVSVLVVFFTVYFKTGRHFITAVMAMIFFASIKSNVNITGLWFFTPLSFSIPFIYLYVYFFTRGFEREDKRSILISFAIMVLLLPIHAISVLFALPFLSLYCLFNLRFVKKAWTVFVAFLIIPVAGLVFYKFMLALPWQSLIGNLFAALQFKYGWGKLEVSNLPSEIYSMIGYVLLIPGVASVLSSRENRKRYLAYLLWPICVFISILLFKACRVSYLTPYQRNLYYLALSLPLLSALGTEYILNILKLSGRFIRFCFFAAIIVSAFWSYWIIPEQIGLYKAIDEKDYRALQYVLKYKKGAIALAPVDISEALYPVTGLNPVATFYFYGNRDDSDKFFESSDCKTKEEILKKYKKLNYIISRKKIDCGWRLVFDKTDYVYKINERKYAK